MQVEVNGVMYEPKEKRRNPPAKSSRMLSQLTAMAMMFGGYDGLGTNLKSRPIPNVDIVKEYGLIQLKESKLSRAERNQVIYLFEKNYKKVDN